MASDAAATVNPFVEGATFEASTFALDESVESASSMLNGVLSVATVLHFFISFIEMGRTYSDL